MLHHVFGIISDMDLNGILQSESDIDLFCLHFVGMNLFQRTLQGYVASWNNHSMRTKGKNPYSTLHFCISFAKGSPKRRRVYGAVC
jgi:hypothetical protein